MRRKCLFALLALALLTSPIIAVSSAYAASSNRMMQRLLRVGGRITRAVWQAYPQRRGQQFRFGLVNGSDLNAMSYPDGRIYVTTGMMAALANRPDDELAAIVGHEATHIAQGHVASQTQRQIAGAILGAILGRAVGGSSQSGAQWGGAITGAAYSRDDEYRADAGSVQLLATAGYNPYAMANVLRLLESRYGRGTAKTPVIGWFASHPDTGKRVENAQRAAAQYRR